MKGMFSAFAAFLDDGDEVLVMEPYFDQVCPFLLNVLKSSTSQTLR